MTATRAPSLPAPTHGSEKAITLALTLAQAERAIHKFAASQVDAVVDADGNTYLLRPAPAWMASMNRESGSACGAFTSTRG